MIDPHEVRPANFPNPQVIYWGEDSSVAFGEWEGRDASLAVRYNGERDDDSDIGHPRRARNPLWFMVPSYLNRAVLYELTFHWQEQDFNRTAWENAARILAP